MATGSTSSTRTRRAARAGSRSTAGSRPHVRPAGARWAADARAFSDEGYMKSTAVSGEREDDPNPSDDLYLHETVASGTAGDSRRRGLASASWSRARAEEEAGRASPLARHDPTEGQLRPLVSVTTAAPKSLPRLQLGHTYRLRLRTVDLAGDPRALPERTSWHRSTRSSPPRRSAASGSSRCRRPSSCAATSTPRANRSSTS